MELVLMLARVFTICVSVKSLGDCGKMCGKMYDSEKICNCGKMCERGKICKCGKMCEVKCMSVVKFGECDQMCKCGNMW